MTEALAGPYCAMMLGDLGADVIKVERPEVGDQARSWGPPFLEGESAYFLSVNRNKRSVALDIKDAADHKTLLDLLGTADVFVTNNPRMDSLRRAALDPESLHDSNPGLVYAAISGYGHSGPKAGMPGYDMIAQGAAGLMALTGEPGSEPLRFPTPMADITAGLYTTIGILSALFARDREGHAGAAGRVVDVALVDAQPHVGRERCGYLLRHRRETPKAGERPSERGSLPTRPLQGQIHHRGRGVRPHLEPLLPGPGRRGHLGADPSLPPTRFVTSIARR